ncbi:MAG: hypothetical protein K2I79_02735, partial [Clostridia bacterium]|nr:hypothetical protein [Clostridia bacterium]
MKANQIRLTWRRLLSILLAITLIMCCIAIFTAPNNTYAFTDDNINNAKDVGDILLKDYATRKDGKVFNNEILADLYEQLTGVEGATLKTVGEKIDSASTYGGQNIWNASDIRDANKIINDNVSKDIILTMVDGMKWIVTSLIKVPNEEGGSDIIATLWRADSNVRNATTGEETSYNHSWNSWYQNATNVTYPSNVYGTSYIRAEGLNIGGGYVASQGADSFTDIDQSEEHPYAKFTMPSVTGSLTSFLVKPSKVTYQEVENQYPNSTIGGVGYSLPNEAYGTPTGSTNWYSNSSKTINMSTMSSKAGYTNWSNDLIWLPSLTETGESSSVYGIWGLSDNQRSNSAVSWLRSGYGNRADGVCGLAAAGSSRSGGYVTYAYDVRPALHLNLSAADSGSAKTLSTPANFKVTYDGSSHDITDANWYNNNKDIYGDSSKMSVTYSESTHVNAKEYTVTFTIENDYLTWSDAKSSTDKTRTCKMTIEKAEPNITPVIGTYTLYPGDGLDKFPSISLGAGAPSGSISWDSGQAATTTKAYNWTFKSKDNNYTDKKGSTTLTVTALDITAIEASFTSSGTIYTSTGLGSLKSGLTVTKKYNNGTSAGTAGQNEYSLSGSLNAGKSTITVTLNGTTITTTFTVDVTAVALTSMTASLSSDGSVYTTTPLDDIKSMLTVTGTN